jgi:hypothetical protein
MAIDCAPREGHVLEQQLRHWWWIHEHALELWKNDADGDVCLESLERRDTSLNECDRARLGRWS